MPSPPARWPSTDARRLRLVAGGKTRVIGDRVEIENTGALDDVSLNPDDERLDGLRQLLHRPLVLAILTWIYRPRQIRSNARWLGHGKGIRTPPIETKASPTLFWGTAATIAIVALMALTLL